MNTGYDGRDDDMQEIVAHLLPECISALFGLTHVGRIVSQSDKVDVVKVLSQLAEYYGIDTTGDRIAAESADEIHRRLVAELPPTLYIYPLKTPEMIEDVLQELYEKQKSWFKAFNAKYADEDLLVCQALEEALWILARIAAYSLYRFVCLHPFCDGNGRMCRLIASAIMSAIVPFPTGLACEQMPGAKTHRVYVNAIVDCRQRDDQKPVELATLIVEGAYYCSQKMKESLREYLKLGEMTCAAEDSENTLRDELASVYKMLGHSRRPGGGQAEKEIETVMRKVKEAIGVGQERVEVEFEDKYFVQVDILL